MTFKRRLRSKASGVSWFLIDRGCEQQECNSPRDGIDTKDRDREVHSAPRGSTAVFLTICNLTIASHRLRPSA